MYYYKQCFTLKEENETESLHYMNEKMHYYNEKFHV